MVTLVTCTGDRPHLFARQERNMRRQTAPWHRWIVVDDGRVATPCALGQDYIRRRPCRNMRRSFAGNLRAGLQAAAGSEYVFIIEDDDWYGAGYMESLLASLRASPLVGERPARYYHVAAQRYRVCGNRHHASLCQTAFHGSLLPRVLSLVTERTALIDLRLWGSVPGTLIPARHSVGLKGQGGRPGITGAHRLKGDWQCDPAGEQLAAWIGPDDAREAFALVAAWTAATGSSRPSTSSNASDAA